MKIAVYPGSFDPITNGHLDIIKRALKCFDKVIVLVGVNPDKKYHNSVEERVAMIKESCKGIKNVEVDSYDGLSVEYSKKHGAVALIRGLRVVSDFEYEWQLATANEYIDSEIDMVFFMARNETSFISSSAINELFEHGVDIKKLVPAPVIKLMKQKQKAKK